MVMETNESWERVDEGLKRAASCCRELCVFTKVNDWVDLANQFLLRRKKAKAMYNAAALTESQVLSLTMDMETAQIAAAKLREYYGH